MNVLLVADEHSTVLSVNALFIYGLVLFSIV